MQGGENYFFVYFFLHFSKIKNFVGNHRFSHIPAHLIDFSSRFCYNGMELFDKSAQTGDIEK